MELIEKDYIKEKKRSVETFEVRINQLGVVDEMFLPVWSLRLSDREV